MVMVNMTHEYNEPWAFLRYIFNLHIKHREQSSYLISYYNNPKEKTNNGDTLWDSFPLHASHLFKVPGIVSNENLSFLEKSFFESYDQDLGLTSALSMAEHLTDEQISGFQDQRFATIDFHPAIA